jgi:uncharacterized membrane protein YhiD involved in acid resistance
MSRTDAMIIAIYAAVCYLLYTEFKKYLEKSIDSDRKLADEKIRIYRNSQERIEEATIEKLNEQIFEFIKEERANSKASRKRETKHSAK